MTDEQISHQYENNTTIFLSIFLCAVLPDMHSVFVLDQKNSIITKVNYSSGIQNSASIVSEISSFGAYGDNSKGREVYVSDNANTMYIFDAKDLTLKKNVDLPLKIESIATNGKGLIFVSTDNSTFENLYVYDRRQDAFVYAVKNQTNNRKKQLKMFSRGNNQLLEVSLMKLGYANLTMREDK